VYKNLLSDTEFRKNSSQLHKAYFL